MKMLLIAATLGALAGTGQAFRLYHCRNIQCDALVNCSGHWNETVHCSSGHPYKCPDRPITEGE